MNVLGELQVRFCIIITINLSTYGTVTQYIIMLWLCLIEIGYDFLFFPFDFFFLYIFKSNTIEGLQSNNKLDGGQFENSGTVEVLVFVQICHIDEHYF